MDGFSMASAYGRPSAFWADVWEQLREEATAGAVFCDGSVTDADEFCEMMSAGHVHPFCIRHHGELGALIWLTNLEGRMCRGHFVVFKKFWGIARYFGSFAVETLLNEKYEDGNYCFDVIVGMIPKINTKAINVAKKSGFVYSGAIPFGAWIKEKGVSVDMVVLAATRGA